MCRHIRGINPNLPEGLASLIQSRAQATYRIWVAEPTRTYTCGYGSAGGSSLVASAEMSAAHPRLPRSILGRDATPPQELLLLLWLDPA
jgi:hypothetical protein